VTTILVVDDQPQNLRLLDAVLIPSGYEVVHASSGAEALEQAWSGAADLVLLDVEMPDLDGYDVCRRLRGDARTAFLPVVLVTSHSREMRADGLDAGADDFVTKPFDRHELLARLRSLLRIKEYHDTIELLNGTLEARVAEQLAELERMSRLRRFLSPTLAELILTQGESILETHRREIAVLFADLRGWTDFSATTEPEEVMAVIAAFHEAMGELIVESEATVGWFAGDGLMVWFNDPIPCDDASARAVRLAVEMRRAVVDLLTAWRRRGHDLDFSVGIALGYATLGRIGFEGRYDYGAVGSVMNLAARLKDEARPGQILVSRRILSEIEGQVELEPVGALKVKGFAKPVEAFAVLDPERVVA
jgi:class 3 adenylate cyclase